MQTVCVGFSKHKTGLLSPLICAIDGTNYSHVYIRRASKYGEYVYQASGLQVNFMSIDTFLKSNAVVEEYKFNIPEDKHNDMISFCIKYAGRPYGIKALFKILFMILFKWKSSGDGDETFVCSELGNVFCKRILGLDIPEDQDFTTPKMLNFYVKKFEVQNG